MSSVRAMVVGFVLAGFLVIGLVIGSRAFRTPGAGSGPSLRNSATVLQRVRSLSEYVTVKYVMEKLVVLEDVRWYGENRVLLVAHGVVKAGLDLDRLEPEDIEVSGTLVIVRLPPPVITEAYLDDRQTRVVERSTGMLRMFDKDLEQEARARAVESIQRAARYSGILEEARSNAERQLRLLLNGLGYVVEFRE